MTEELIQRIKDIQGIEFESLDKDSLIDLLKLMITIWEMEDEPKIKDAITMKLKDISDYLVTFLPPE